MFTQISEFQKWKAARRSLYICPVHFGNAQTMKEMMAMDAAAYTIDA